MNRAAGAMSEFVIDSGEENSYSLAAPKGVKAEQLVWCLTNRSTRVWLILGCPKDCSAQPRAAAVHNDFVYLMHWQVIYETPH